MGIQLPPQAYTRDTMIQAYEWLQSQPPSIRELASSPDALVSLYMQARRRGGAQVMATHPVSSQAFKQDLKNLAEGLRQFENQDDTHGPSHGPAPMNHGAPAQSHGQPNMQAATGATASPTVNVMVTPNYQNPGYQSPPPNYQHMAPMGPPAGASHLPMNIDNHHDDILATLDSKSHEMVRRVQSRFNLSSEKESVRMLIALGFEKVREMLPKG